VRKNKEREVGYLERAKAISDAYILKVAAF